jgi:hypothetical protein
MSVITKNLEQLRFVQHLIEVEKHDSFSSAGACSCNDVAQSGNQLPSESFWVADSGVSCGDGCAWSVKGNCKRHWQIKARQEGKADPPLPHVRNLSPLGGAK